MSEGQKAHTGARDDVGLCRTCRHSRQVPTPRVLYWLCTLSETDPRFDKYPRLPVIECDGYAPARPGEEAPRSPSV